MPMSTNSKQNSTEKYVEIKYSFFKQLEKSTYLYNFINSSGVKILNYINY